MEATLIKAFAISCSEVRVMYRASYLQEFVVSWSNIHPSTGEAIDFYLVDECLSGSDQLNERIINAIKEGETDENPDLDLYLCIRDTFDRGDVEQLAASINN